MENCLLLDMHGSNKVVLFTYGGRLVRSYEVERPSGMAIGGAGFSLVTTYTNPGPPSTFDPNGQLIHKIEGLHLPQDTKITSDDSVRVNEYGGNKLHKYIIYILN